MSEMGVFLRAPDQAMDRASARARETFRFFWRELTWEHRRMISGLDLSAVKFSFEDSTGSETVSEQMWVTDVAFDGRSVSGRLLNQPRRVTNVAAGDRVSRGLPELSDWIYAIEGVAYGAFTVDVLRAEMTSGARAQHDRMWGLDFGDPEAERLFPEWARDGHPMAAETVGALKDHLHARPEEVDVLDVDGMTLLHHMAMAGAEPCVRVLLAAGADRSKTTPAGDTPLGLARHLGWSAVERLLAPEKVG